MSRKKIGLALSSGAARGLAHIGVLEALEKEGIPIDMIAGTSAGALIGAIYAYTEDINQVKKWTKSLASSKLAFLAYLTAHLTPTRTGLISGKRIESRLRSTIGDIKFSDLKLPFACVATDIGSGEEVVIKEGSVIEALRASFSVPGLFAVVKYKDRYLVDGGLVNPVPVSVLKEMGADFIIASNVIPDMKNRVNRASTEQKTANKAPNVFEVLMRTIHIAAYQAVRFSLAGADIVIEPRVVHIGFGDFHRAEECAVQGKIVAENAISEIKEKLGL